MNDTDLNNTDVKNTDVKNGDRRLLIPQRKLAGSGVLLALVFLIFTDHLSAQVAGAALTVTVSDRSSAVIPNAQVTVKNEDSGITNTVVTNGEGVSRVPNLLPGKYRVSVNVPQFKTSVQQGIQLTVGAEQTLNFTLTPGAVQENVDVTDTAPAVETGSANLNSVVLGTAIRELPLNGRDWTALATLQPGISAIQSQASVSSTSSRGNRGWGNQLTVAGHRPQENNYRIDGVSVNDYTNGSPGSVGGANLGADAIAEFSVLQSNYSAEYGRTSGGVINGITRSGSKDFHGTAYEFARNGALDARNYFNPVPANKPEFSRHQFGASAGGPIVQQKSFIFGDYEGIRQNQGVANVATVPSDNARLGNLAAGAIVVSPLVQPFLQFLPKVNGGLLGQGDVGRYVTTNIQDYNQDFFTVRADHRFSQTDSLFGTYLFDDSTLLVPDTLNNVTFSNRSRRQMIALEESHTFSPNFQNAARIGYNRTFGFVNGPGSALNPIAADVALGTVPGLPAAQVTITGITTFGGLGYNTYANHVQNSYQAYDDAYLSHGKHTLKFGMAFERVQYNELLIRRPNGVFSFSSLTNFLTDRPTQAQLTSASVKGKVGTRESVIAGYLQDDWRLSPRLTVNLGLRYEFATNPTEAKNMFYAVRDIFGGQQLPVKNYFTENPTKWNFEPRLGIAWDPNGDGKTSLRVAFGIFDVLPLPWLVTPHAAGDFPFAVNTTVRNLQAGAFPRVAYNLADFTKTAGTYVDPNPRRNYVMNWHLTLQRQLPAFFTATVGYTGTRSIHNSFGSDDVNLVFPVSQTPAGYVWPATGGAQINPNVGVLRAIFFDGTASYHGLQAQINRQMTKGFQAQASYTWGHCIDTGSSGARGDTFTNGLNDLLFFDRSHRSGNCDFDVRHNFVVNSLWNIPGPRSKRFLAGVLKNWQVGGIFSANTGTPFTVLIGGDPLGLGIEDPLQFPDRVGAPGCGRNPVTGDPNQYIRTECFVVPNPSKRIGNSGRNSATGPSQVALNFALYKNIPVHESFSLQFRAELFDALNHPNFAAPIGNNAVFLQSGAPNPSAGLITSTTSPNRQIQLGLRARW